jgi:hypothetical protein
MGRFRDILYPPDEREILRRAWRERSQEIDRLYARIKGFLADDLEDGFVSLEPIHFRIDEGLDATGLRITIIDGRYGGGVGIVPDLHGYVRLCHGEGWSFCRHVIFRDAKDAWRIVDIPENDFEAPFDRAPRKSAEFTDRSFLSTLAVVADRIASSVQR